MLSWKTKRAEAVLGRCCEVWGAGYRPRGPRRPRTEGPRLGIRPASLAGPARRSALPAQFRWGPDARDTGARRALLGEPGCGAGGQRGAPVAREGHLPGCRELQRPQCEARPLRAPGPRPLPGAHAPTDARLRPRPESPCQAQTQTRRGRRCRD